MYIKKLNIIDINILINIIDISIIIKHQAG